MISRGGWNSIACLDASMHHAGAKTQHLWSAAAADTATCTNPLINSHTCNAWLLVECGVSRDAVGRARVEAWEHPVCSNRWMLMKGWSKTCATASVSPALASPAGQDLWKGGVAFVDHRPARLGCLPHRNTALKHYRLLCTSWQWAAELWKSAALQMEPSPATCNTAVPPSAHHTHNRQTQPP